MTSISTSDNYSGLVLYSTAGGIVALASVAIIKAKWYESGTLSNLTVYITTNTSGNACTVSTLKNSAVAGNQSISITTATTGSFTDPTNTDAVVSGDLWYLKWAAVSSGSGTCRQMTVLFEAAVDTSTAVGFISATPLGTSPSVGVTTVGGLNYASGFVATGSESTVQTKIKTAGTFKFMYLYVQTNTKGTNTTFGLRINGTNGTITASVTSSTTGVFEDATHSDTIASGDLVDWYVTG